MKELKKHLKSLSVVDQRIFAQEAGTSIGYLRKKLSTGGDFGEKLVARIERTSKGAVRRWDLRPDDWWEIWPELIDTKGAPAVPEPQSVSAA